MEFSLNIRMVFFFFSFLLCNLKLVKFYRAPVDFCLTNFILMMFNVLFTSIYILDLYTDNCINTPPLPQSQC